MWAGGTGMMTYEFKGGMGTSSRRVDLGDERFTIAALVQSNFGSRHNLMVRGVPVGKEWSEDAPLTEAGGAGTRLDHRDHRNGYPRFCPISSNAWQNARALGIGRTGSPGGHYSGDIMLAFSTGNDIGLPQNDGRRAPTVQTQCSPWAIIILKLSTKQW